MPTSLIEQVPSKSKLLVAISGGPDSVYLFYQLLNLAAAKNFTLHLAHFNHNTRGQESDKDEIFVQNLAQQYNLPLTTKKRPQSPNEQLLSHFSEEKLRKLRYAFLAKTRLTTKSDFIVTAHTLDDHIETIFFNFLRGTGPQGLTGISFQNNNILHPLLDTLKTDILKYLQTKQLPFCCDESNNNLDYTRNYLRQIIIPQIKKINPNFYQSLSQLSAIISSQQDFIQQQTIKSLKKISLNSIVLIGNWKLEIGNLLPAAVRSREGKIGNWKLEIKKKLIELDLKKYNILHSSIKTQIIHYLISPLVPTNKQITYKQIIEICDILQNSRGGSQKILFNTLSITKKNGKITLYKL